jgi:secreted trypsin-like serine protease
VDHLDGSRRYCGGDSGEPLVQNVGINVVQIGVVSWSYSPCGNQDRLGVFIGVSNYLKWIGAQTNKLK